MLLALTHATGEEEFTKILSLIEKAYWPEDEYIACHDNLPRWSDPPEPMERLQAINESLKDITKNICEKGLYQLIDSSGNIVTDEAPYVLPFMERFHEYFLARQWNEPIRDPVEDYGDIVMLEKPDKKEKRRNYSKNVGNYNHFVNIVAACARLIQFFSEIKNFDELQMTSDAAGVEGKKLLNALVYGKGTTHEEMRRLMLLLAAFYHDLGKTVVTHRHAMEGAMIIAGHPTKSLYHLGRIMKKRLGVDLSREDLLFIGDLLNHHDQFGTLSTGETGYVRLTSIVDGFKRYGKRVHNQDLQNCKLLFDLWLLNVADMCVSMEKKYVKQPEWRNPIEAKEKIEKFRRMPLWDYLVHDLNVSMSLLMTHERYNHSSNTLELQKEALRYSSRHVVERVRRLLVAIVKDEELSDLSSKDEWYTISWDAIIYRNIESLSDVAEFSRRFSLIGQMDYALGFFKKIAQRAALHVRNEIKFQSGEPKTGWIHIQRDSNEATNPPDPMFLNNINRSFFADNLASTVLQIIDFLLFREKEVDQIRNFEFVEATTRLTDEKIDKIMTLEGPYRAQKTIEQILKTIFIY
jgi:hypothetical protein